jgi:hypothetical protein
MCLGQTSGNDGFGAVSADQSPQEATMHMVTTSWTRGVAAVALALLAAPMLAACGDDANAGSSTTIAESAEQYGARVDAECPGGDPGFDSFLAAHPVPTATDWAEFLPAPRTMLAELRACIAASHPPAAIADDIDAVVAAFDVVIDDFDEALEAAQSGDLESTDKWLTKMHDIDQPKIDEAISRVGVG